MKLLLIIEVIMRIHECLAAGFCCFLAMSGQKKPTKASKVADDFLVNNICAKSKMLGDEKHIYFIYKDEGFSKWDRMVNKIKSLYTFIKCGIPTEKYHYGADALRSTEYTGGLDGAGVPAFVFPDYVRVTYESDRVQTGVPVTMRDQIEGSIVDSFK